MANRTIAFRMEPSLHAKLEDMARHDYVSYGSIIRVLIAQEYERRQRAPMPSTIVPAIPWPK